MLLFVPAEKNNIFLCKKVSKFATYSLYSIEGLLSISFEERSFRSGSKRIKYNILKIDEKHVAE